MERPILMKAGPSPRMRAFASQDTLTFSSSAASFGVNNLIADGCVDFCGLLPVSTETCELILFSPLCYGPIHRAVASTDEKFPAKNHIDKRGSAATGVLSMRFKQAFTTPFQPLAAGLGTR
jgi:hypothetical protein